MRTPDPDFSKLTVAERIQLVEDLWDSIAADTDGPPVTPEQAMELGRRLREVDRDPEAGESWETVRSRIERRLDRAG